MTAANESDNTPLPGTVFTPRQVRVLKVAVIVMGILLVGGFAFVMAAIVYQASNLGKDDAAAPTPAAVSGAGLALPAGTTVTSMALDGDRLALHLKTADGSEIAVIDVATGSVLSRIRIGAQ